MGDKWQNHMRQSDELSHTSLTGILYAWHVFGQLKLSTTDQCIRLERLQMAESLDGAFRKQAVTTAECDGLA